MTRATEGKTDVTEGLTEAYIKIIVLAQDESRRLGQDFVCTEHILIGTDRKSVV